jgi:hypothetical protein
MSLCDHPKTSVSRRVMICNFASSSERMFSRFALASARTSFAASYAASIPMSVSQPLFGALAVSRNLANPYRWPRQSIRRRFEGKSASHPSRSTEAPTGMSASRVRAKPFGATVIGAEPSGRSWPIAAGLQSGARWTKQTFTENSGLAATTHTRRPRADRPCHKADAHKSSSPAVWPRSHRLVQQHVYFYADTCGKLHSGCGLKERRSRHLPLFGRCQCRPRPPRGDASIGDRRYQIKCLQNLAGLPISEGVRENPHHFARSIDPAQRAIDLVPKIVVSLR